MALFLKASPASMATSFDLTNYEEVSGSLDKSGCKKECAVIHDTRILCSSSSARDAILSMLAAIADQAEKEEEGTYSFWVLKSLDHDDQVRIFERYASWDALTAYQNSQALVRLWLDSKEDIKSLEGRPYVSNQKGWLNRS
jgi:quinol monooxygenase YgiN